MKLKNILESDIRSIHEFIEMDVSKGDILYLDDIELEVIDTRPLPFNPPRVINTSSGKEFTLRSNDIKKLTKTPPKIDSYKIEKSFREWIYNSTRTREYPNQSMGFIKFLDSNKKSDIIQISFTEEVKDGRTPQFNTSDFIKLKGKVFNNHGVSIKVQNVTFDETDIDKVKGREYQRHYYKVKLSK